MAKVVPDIKFVDLPGDEQESLLAVCETFILRKRLFNEHINYRDALITMIEMFERGTLKFSYDTGSEQISLLIYDPIQETYVKPLDSVFYQQMRPVNGSASG